MKNSLLILLVFLSSYGNAKGNDGGPRDSTFFITWDLGLNGFSNNSSIEEPFGIGVSESAFGFGPYIAIGWEYRMKNKFGIHINAAANFSTRNKKRFIPEFDAFYSDYDVRYQVSTYTDKPFIKGGQYYSTQIALSYLFRLNGVGMFPKVVFGWQSSVGHNYRYTLRVPTTNAFTNYNVTNSPQWSPYVALGYTVLFSEHDLAGISAELGYGNMRNNYTVTQSGFDQSISYSEINTSNQKLYWKISLLLRMDFALMK